MDTCGYHFSVAHSIHAASCVDSYHSSRRKPSRVSNAVTSQKLHKPGSLNWKSLNTARQVLLRCQRISRTHAKLVKEDFTPFTRSNQSHVKENFMV